MYVDLSAGVADKKTEAYYWMSEIYRKMGRRKDTEDAKEKVLSLQRRLSGEKKTNAAGYAAKIRQGHFRIEKTCVFSANVATPSQIF